MSRRRMSTSASGAASNADAVGVDGSTLHYPNRRGRTVRPANLTGMRFGRLIVVRYLRRDSKGQPVWSADCDCGTTGTEVPHKSLLRGWRVSCGCRRAETKEEWKTINFIHGAKSGGRVSPEYQVWQSMKDRCLNPNNQDFAYYGGRGIAVCDLWRDSFEAFLDDMGPRPSLRHWIDRLDTDGNYEPGNCAWRTALEQQRNRRNNRRVEWRGETMLLGDWAERLGIEYDTLRYRLDSGWDVERAFTQPIKPSFPEARRKRRPAADRGAVTEAG